MWQKLPSTYQLKITLNNIRPQIWRRIIVPDYILLSDLHMVVQIAMGWTNSHLHGFVIGNNVYSIPYPESDWNDAREIDSTTVRLQDAVPDVKTRFRYDYDYGDDWEHDILVEKILLPDAKIHFPACLAGKRACPPEDCGGPWGYAALLKTLSNPSHPDYKSARRWVGSKFDPEAFDLEKVNKKVGRLRV